MATETIKMGNTTAAKEFEAIRAGIEKKLMELDWFCRKMEAKRGTYQAEDEYTELAEFFGVTDHDDPLADAEELYKRIKWSELALVEADDAKLSNVSKMLFDIAEAS